jgi:hypothetical protein
MRSPVIRQDRAAGQGQGRGRIAIIIRQAHAEDEELIGKIHPGHKADQGQVLTGDQKETWIIILRDQLADQELIGKTHQGLRAGQGQALIL